jgi:hypothetical protein
LSGKPAHLTYKPIRAQTRGIKSRLSSITDESVKTYKVSFKVFLRIRMNAVDSTTNRFRMLRRVACRRIRLDSSFAQKGESGRHVYLCYADDSGDNTSRSITAVLVEDKNWSSLMAKWLAARVKLTDTWGVRKHAELHALELAKQRGSFCETNQQERVFVHVARRRAYEMMMNALADVDGLVTFTVAARETRLPIVYALFIERLERWATTNETQVMVLLDGPDGSSYLDDNDDNDEADAKNERWFGAQKNAQPYRRVHRELDVGRRRVLEDVIMQDSENSQLIQAADLCAYAAFHTSKKQHPERWNTQGILQDAALAAHQRFRNTWPEDSDDGIYWVELKRKNPRD